ncbi:ABC transporter ATP-binding protein [Caedibacter taeniospiralis]|jgi:ABC-type multidrug transport system fused ATPase/permease subunit|uniref:ABC transporter ATP-binding protein n=1 Tax=Caedibacter taeniospiralis TaxID=28907 RepID=UPI0037C11C16
MKKFKYYFFGIMDAKDRKKFWRYVIVLFLGSVFSILGIGAVIPFINILIQPDKVMGFWLFQGMTYHQVILLLTVILIVAFAIKNVAALGLIAYQSRFLFGLMAKVQGNLFKGYMALPYEYHLNRSTPDLIKNVNNETTMLSNYVVAPFGTFLIEFLSSIFVLIVLLLINPIFTILVTIFLILGVILFMKLIKKKIEYYSNLRSEVCSSMTENVLAGLSGIKEAKLYHCENSFLTAFEKDASLLKSSSTFQNTFQQAPRMMIEFIGLAVVMSVLCGFVLVGSSPQDMFILLGVFGVAAAQLLPSLNRLTQAMVQIKYGMSALEGIYRELKQVKQFDLDLLAQKKIVKEPLFNSVISLNGLHYSYQDGTKALKGVSLDISKNKKIAFVGESGAGKTTLVDLIMGLYAPLRGDIKLDGSELSSDEAKLSFQKLFAYIPQSIVLYDKTIRENIAFGVNEGDIDDFRVKKCLEAALLDKFVEQLNKKEYTFIGEAGVRLSGGQRQRVGIARALYQNPQILVMDEATSALDNNTEKEVTEVLSRLTNLTIITIAHRLTTIKDYDVIYVMKDGKVVSTGSYDGLLKNCETFRKIALVKDNV